MKKFVDLVKSMFYSVFTCGSKQRNSIEAVANTVRNLPVIESAPVKRVKTVKKPKSVKVETEVVVPKDPQEVKVISAIEQIKTEGGKVNITNIAKHAKVSTTVVKKYFKK